MYLQVEVARDFGDANKPRAWSKYSKESSANQRLAQEGSANQRLAQESSANQRLVLEKQIDKEDERNKKSSKKVLLELKKELQCLHGNPKPKKMLIF